MLKLIDKCHYISTYSLPKIEKNEWEKIKQNKCSYKIDNSNFTSHLLYPGFCFSNDEAVNYYYKNIYSIFESAITPPRGNLSKNNKYIVIGIKPGTYFSHYSLAESSWLLGPSSRMLHKLLLELGIYPYFTNIYKNYTDIENKKIDTIVNEIVNIFYMYESCYDINSIKHLNIICLGNYKEYDILNTTLAIRSDRPYPKIHKIWHPSYILRKNTSEMFIKWKNQFKDIVKEDVL